MLSPPDSVGEEMIFLGCHVVQFVCLSVYLFVYSSVHIS